MSKHCIWIVRNAPAHTDTTTDSRVKATHMRRLADRGTDEPLIGRCTVREELGRHRQRTCRLGVCRSGREGGRGCQQNGQSAG